MPSFDLPASVMSIIECLPIEVMRWSMNGRPVFTFVAPLPSMFTCTVTDVSLVTRSTLALLAAANINQAGFTLFNSFGRESTLLATASAPLSTNMARVLPGSGLQP